MKRFLLYCFLLSLCVVALAAANDVANLWLIRASSGNPAYKMERLWRGYERDEIPILGSSRAQSNFVPSEISPHCFNYGCDGMCLEEVVFLLNQIAKRDSCLPVIVNLDPLGFDGFAKLNFVGDYRLVPESGRIEISESLPGLRFHGALRKSLTSWLNVRKAVTKVIDNGAVLLKNSRTDEEWRVMNLNLTSWSFVRNSSGEALFETALSALSPRKAIVVVGPCCSRFMELYPSGLELEKYLNHLKTLDNVIVINFFRSPHFTDQDFADPTHLNIEGARKFTRMFVDSASQVMKW